MTVSDVPLASATPKTGADLPRASTRARARVAVTVRDRKIGAIVVRIRAILAGDLRRWWLIAARPTSLRAWLRAQRPAVARVPAGSSLLRRAWTVDNWTFGLLVRGLSIVVFLAGGALVYLAGHPLRRWTALLIAAAFAGWVVLS